MGGHFFNWLRGWDSNPCGARALCPLDLPRPSKERILTHECYLLNIETVSCTESGWKEVLSSIDNRVLYRIPPDYPKFQNIMYPIDVFIPLVDLHQESFWIPTTPGFKILMWLHILVGWFLTTIGVVGLSGIVKQD